MSDATAFRRCALGFTGVEELPHHDRTSFRVAGKIFATLDEDSDEGVLKLSLADQSALLELNPDAFHLVGWAHQGWIGVHLDQVSDAELPKLLGQAWRNVAPSQLQDEAGSN